VIGGSVAAVAVVIGAVVVIAAGRGAGPKAGPAKQPDGPAASAVTKPARAATTVAPKGLPPEIRVTAVIDGKDELRLTPESAQWVHHSWGWPPDVRMNAVTWVPERTPLLGTAGLTALAGRRVRDPGTARLTKVRGRGPVTLDASRDVVRVVFDDDGPLGADTYEVVLTFDP
jgi:hypothetical protein